MITAEPSVLVKETLAARLREAIVERRLRPGQRVIEAEWAREFGVAQASVREAINLLILDGFLIKTAGRSARVPQYTQEDVACIYEVRGALEGLAARLAAAKGADLGALDAALARMEAALAKEDVKELVESDLDFHLALAKAADNPVLGEILSRLLRPLFTFVLLRIMETPENIGNWLPDIPRHRQMIAMIRETDSPLAGQFVQHCVSRLAVSAWSPKARPKRRKKS
jgi:DNA-binding GntR family transcriptional regulator